LPDAKGFLFLHMSFICFNGRFHRSDTPVFPVQNRGYKYGDGLFETIKVYRRTILHRASHFERLASSLELLQLSLPVSPEQLETEVLELCRRNQCLDSGRVRLSIYRSEEGPGGYAIEAVALPAENHQWNEQGWTIGLYPFARKSVDAFSNIKSANFLPYVMAARYAKEKSWDDCLVLNAEGRICDASKANIFVVRHKELYTPALDQGCVNGVQRRHVIEAGKCQGLVIHQSSLSEQDLLEADEVFLTNAIIGLRWVSQFRERQFSSTLSKEIYRLLFQPSGEEVG
jgi:branched-chain amino acid aminotransferase